eukprot:GFKZ01004646.1.p1 GENE.GFKZ01004646.1~~GFKZ01004646.1.p1  ORF type:complete len:300 (+),score=38.12 GFKZ01004646.1:113-901(+)
MTPAFLQPLMTTSPSRPRRSVDTPPPSVFVAGATGNVGYRLVRYLAEQGCAVRAGSRDPDKCRSRLGKLPAEVDQFIDHVPFDVTKRRELRDAIGEAEVVVSALGAPFSWGRVDGIGIADLMTEAAEMREVKYLVVVSSIGVGRPWVFPSGLLNLFGGVLLWKDYSEAVLRRRAKQAGKGYLIVRPGGMERPTDELKKTHAVRLEGRNRLSGGIVSCLQVAELIGDAIVGKQWEGGKTVEVVAEEGLDDVGYQVLLQNARLD